MSHARREILQRICDALEADHGVWECGLAESDDGMLRLEWDPGELTWSDGDGATRTASVGERLTIKLSRWRTPNESFWARLLGRDQHWLAVELRNASDVVATVRCPVDAEVVDGLPWLELDAPIVDGELVHALLVNAQRLDAHVASWPEQSKRGPRVARWRPRLPQLSERAAVFSLYLMPIPAGLITRELTEITLVLGIIAGLLVLAFSVWCLSRVLVRKSHWLLTGLLLVGLAGMIVAGDAPRASEAATAGAVTLDPSDELVASEFEPGTPVRKTDFMVLKGRISEAPGGTDDDCRVAPVVRKAWFGTGPADADALLEIPATWPHVDGTPAVDVFAICCHPQRCRNDFGHPESWVVYGEREPELAASIEKLGTEGAYPASDDPLWIEARWPGRDRAVATVPAFFGLLLFSVSVWLVRVIA